MVENRGLHRPALLVAVLVVLALAAGACSGGGASRPLHYVSLGDSYPAGEGLAKPDQPCGRTPGAYPSLVAQHDHLIASLHACNGATTADVLDREREPGEGRQIDAVTAGADVVTVTIGGNDLGFADVMADCVVNEQPCTRLDAQVTAALAALAPRLAQIDSQIRQRAPHATLVAVGYPQLVIDPATSSFPTCAGLTPDESRWVREKGDALNAEIRAAAEAAGGHYVDAAGPFAGREACSAQPWMEGVNVTDIVASFHPNAAGQQELAKLVEAALPRR